MVLDIFDPYLPGAGLTEYLDESVPCCTGWVRLALHEMPDSQMPDASNMSWLMRLLSVIMVMLACLELLSRLGLMLSLAVKCPMIAGKC